MWCCILKNIDFDGRGLGKRMTLRYSAKINHPVNPLANRPGMHMLRHQKTTRRDQPATSAQTLAEAELLADPTLCCAVCLHRITSAIESIEKLGQHEHHCTNPHGYHFLIACFGSAAGCENTGSWVSQHSWFPGYLWRYSLCAACHTHLGWQFKAGQDDFYGLIKVRLISYENLH